LASSTVCGRWLADDFSSAVPTGMPLTKSVRSTDWAGVAAEKRSCRVTESRLRR
jgi:hypothetical protein